MGEWVLFQCVRHVVAPCFRTDKLNTDPREDLLFLVARVVSLKYLYTKIQHIQLFEMHNLTARCHMGHLEKAN